MTPEDTGYHPPIDLASRRACPAEHQPIEGGGVPTGQLLAIFLLALFSILVLVAGGALFFFNGK